MTAYVELYLDQGTTFNNIINITDDVTNAYVNVYGSFGLAASSVNNFITTNTMGSGAAAYNSPIFWSDYTYNVSLSGTEVVEQSTENLVSLNLGKGLNFGASFGYMFNDYLGAELGLNYLIGGKTSYTEQYTNALDPANPEVTSFDGEISATQFRFNPMIVVSTDFMDFVPYAKFGVMIGIGTKISETYTDNTTPDVTIAQK